VCLHLCGQVSEVDLDYMYRYAALTGLTVTRLPGKPGAVVTRAALDADAAAALPTGAALDDALAALLCPPGPSASPSAAGGHGAVYPLLARASTRDLVNPRSAPSLGCFVKFQVLQRVTTGGLFVTNVEVVEEAEAVGPTRFPAEYVASRGAAGAAAASAAAAAAAAAGSESGEPGDDVVGKVGRGFITMVHKSGEGFILCPELGIQRLFVHVKEVRPLPPLPPSCPRP
jgi:hypothetical protein